MRRISVNIHPKDGYFFKEADGTIIRGTNWASVISRVLAYRKRNGLALGSPIEEVHAQACARDPNNCHEDQDMATKTAIRVATLKGRVLAWMAGLRARKPLQFVDEPLMRARAAVCARCPAHATVTGGCGSCKRAIKEVRIDLLGGRPIDERVSGCVVLGEDCAVNAWLADPTVNNPELPACCWRKIS